MASRTLANPDITVSQLENAVDGGLTTMGVRDLDQILDLAHEQTAWRATARIDHLAPAASFSMELLRGGIDNGVAPTKKLESAIATRNKVSRLRFKDMKDCEWYVTRGHVGYAPVDCKQYVPLMCHAPAPLAKFVP